MATGDRYQKARQIGCLPYLWVLMVIGSLFSGQGVKAQEAITGNPLILQVQFDRLVKEEASLRREMKEGVRLAARPYAGYLLHQKSLQLGEIYDRLEEVKQEKMNLIQGLTKMGEPFDPVFRDFHPNPLNRKIALSSTYSGAPLLSFNNAVQEVPEGFPRVGPFWISVFRILFLGFVMLILLVPIIAIQMGWTGLSHERGKRFVRVFPILTVQGSDGHCELLSLPMKAGSH